MKTTTGATGGGAVITAWKGFDRNLQCREFQYEIGKTYQLDGNLAACSRDFHACENPLDIWAYYEPFNSRFCRVIAGGEITRQAEYDSKIACQILTVDKECGIRELVIAAVDWIQSQAKQATSGNSAHSATSGDYAHSATSGKNSVAATCGRGSKAKAEMGGAIMLAAYDSDGNLVAVFASLVGQNGIEPGKTYRLGEDGKPIEVK
jgi:hypothetical protein